MIGMLVGDENAVDTFGTFAAQRFKTPQRFFAADAGINQESRRGRLD